ncbi:hypothetical protein [Streptomyces sp. NPDC048411]|uniref:hypothetical protein n=1 Tax=Streptomyces sp. NPDC048411 TaxID=3157206 RepID=UPI00345656A9
MLDRPDEEHHALHGVIERIDQVLVAGVGGEDGDGSATMALRSAIDLPTDVLGACPP